MQTPSQNSKEDTYPTTNVKSVHNKYVTQGVIKYFQEPHPILEKYSDSHVREFSLERIQYVELMKSKGLSAQTVPLMNSISEKIKEYIRDDILRVNELSEEILEKHLVSIEEKAPEKTLTLSLVSVDYKFPGNKKKDDDNTIIDPVQRVSTFWIDIKEVLKIHGYKNIIDNNNKLIKEFVEVICRKVKDKPQGLAEELYQEYYLAFGNMNCISDIHDVLLKLAKQYDYKYQLRNNGFNNNKDNNNQNNSNKDKGNRFINTKDKKKYYNDRNNNNYNNNNNSKGGKSDTGKDTTKDSNYKGGNDNGKVPNAPTKRACAKCNSANHSISKCPNASQEEKQKFFDSLPKLRARANANNVSTNGTP